MMGENKRFLVFLGNAGVGKSRIIGTLTTAHVPSGGELTVDDQAFTRRTTEYTSKEFCDLVIVDTVGLDQGNPSLTSYYDKQVAFAVIHDKPVRGGVLKTKVENLIGKEMPFKMYLAHNIPPSESIPSISSFDVRDISFKTLTRSPVDPPKVNNMPVTKLASIAQRHMKCTPTPPARLFFGKDQVNLGAVEQAILDMHVKFGGFFVSDKKKLRGNPPTNELLTSLDKTMVDKFRMPGEKLLEYVLYCMYDRNTVEQMKSNETLASLVTDNQYLWKHFCNLYPGGVANQTNDETRADYIEALYVYVHCNHRGKLVSLTKYIVEHLQAFKNVPAV
jgi:energy-coupling factor transporter ATP-binding protein EcfA2